MTITEAAHTLWELLQGKGWFQTVGIGAKEGEQTLVLYMNHRPRKFEMPADWQGKVPRTWGGYKLFVRNVGPMAPLGPVE